MTEDTKSTLLTGLIAIPFIVIFCWWKLQGGGETPAPRAAAPPLYSQADLPSNEEINSYIDVLVPALNRVAKEDWTCKENLDPISVGINKLRSEHYAEIVFQVRCWKDNEKNSIIYFDIDGQTIAPYMKDPFK